jgi:hypothetical protein
MTDKGTVTVTRQVPVFGNVTGKKTLGQIKTRPVAANKPLVETKPLR